MRVSVVSNIWLRGRACCRGELIELSEAEAERLAIRGVVEPACDPAPAQDPEVTPEVAPVEIQAPARVSRKRKAKK